MLLAEPIVLDTGVDTRVSDCSAEDNQIRVAGVRCVKLEILSVAIQDQIVVDYVCGYAIYRPLHRPYDGFIYFCGSTDEGNTVTNE